MNYYRTGWISDVHLGTYGSQAAALLDFLRENEFETLFLVGDILDIWALRRGIFWPQEHNDVIQKILRKGRNGTEIIYIVGNHDEFLSGFLGSYGNVTIKKHAFHTTSDGRRMLVMHGHELDTVVQNMGWLAHIGDLGYGLLLRCNGLVNALRHLLGFEHWSLSAYVKSEVKNVVGFIGQFEKSIVRYAQDYGVEAVLCGHIHTASIRNIGGVEYLNTGDWVETCSAIVEHHDGRLELIRRKSSPDEPIHAKATPKQASERSGRPSAAVLEPLERHTENAPAGWQATSFLHPYEQGRSALLS